jgi:hypothetical protein
MTGGSQNTVSQTTVPSWLQPYMTQQAQSGESLVQGGGPQYYPGQQVAGLTPLQNMGISGVQQTASAPNASTMADQQNQTIESGAYLNPATNPYLSGTLTTAEQGVQNPITSEFGSAGRNVLSSAPVQSSAMNQLANQIYGGAYQSGMQNMVQAGFAAPSLDQGTYLPSQEEIQTGAGVQQQNQNQINALMNQYNYQQQLPENMLSWYSGLLGNTAAPFSSSSSSGSSTINPWLTAAGAGTALYGSGILGAAGTALSGLFSSGLGEDFLAGMA